MPEEINDNSLYLVKVNKVIKVGRSWLRPKDRVVLKGSKLKELQEYVVAYEFLK